MWGCLLCGCFSPVSIPAWFLRLERGAEGWSCQAIVEPFSNDRTPFTTSPPLASRSGMQNPARICTKPCRGTAVPGSRWWALARVDLGNRVFARGCPLVAVVSSLSSLRSSVAGVERRPRCFRYLKDRLVCSWMEKERGWSEVSWISHLY